MTTDWKLTEDWDLKIGNFTDYKVTGMDELVQRLKTRLQFFLGELYFDTTQGVPYYQNVFKKGATYDEISNSIKLQIAKTKNIKKITSFELNKVDGDPRAISISFAASSDFGDVTINNLSVS